MRGRYSMIGLAPDLIWRCRGDTRRDQPRRAASSPTPSSPAREPPLEACARCSPRAPSTSPSEGLPPMAAGVFGYLGYDMVRHMERLPAAQPRRARRARRACWCARPDGRLRRREGRDHRAHARPPARRASAARAAWEAAQERHRGRRRARSRAPCPPAPAPPRRRRCRARRVVQHHAGRVPRPWWRGRRSTSVAGDIFQVVLSQRFEAPFDLPAFALYRALRRVNPAPFLCYLDFGGFQVVCSSPEILVRVRDGKVTIRPIAGTRPRGATAERDKALAEELLADPKERAEHLMLLDLGRNDVGRVARDRHGHGDRQLLHRALQPGDAHRLQRRGRARPAPRRARRAGRRLPGRHGLRRAQGARHGDHRRAGEGQARALCRLHRLFRRQWRDGHLHRAAHRAW